ncbi:MAG: phospholipase D family protein [bacterium]|nr:phospholipase D family protein [Gammaproteobacteria bacterium]HIL99229.1 phospholipase D family protein [Pseudomonadales bacterium]
MDTTSPFSKHLKDSIEQRVHYAYLLETGDDALLARIFLIRNARVSIDIQTFIWSEDECGSFIFHELFLAASRGVTVRLLFDDLTLRSKPDYVAYLATLHPNLLLKQYNPLSKNLRTSMIELIAGLGFNFRQSNQRMHNKIIVVDGQFGITGGRNCGNDYFDRDSERTFKDRDVLILGPAVSDMQRSFESYWDFELTFPSKEMHDLQHSIRANNYPRLDLEDGYVIPSMFKDLTRLTQDHDAFRSRIVDYGFRLDQVQFVADQPGKVASLEDSANTTRVLTDLIRSANESIVIQSPYLVLSKEGQRLFKDVGEKKPTLITMISTNSLAAADHYYAYAFSYKNKKAYVKKLSWQIFELKPRPTDESTMSEHVKGVQKNDKHHMCIHSKTFMFDKKKTFIGSFNLDPRSVMLNTEAGLLISDEKFSSHVHGLIMKDIAPQNSWTIGVRQKQPVLKYFNELFENLFAQIPFANIWPFTYTTSYQLKPGGIKLAFNHPDFQQHYDSVGMFPEQGVSLKTLKTRLVKAFFGPIEPMI